jgi:O-antigen/teichoic acid export membrane protein
LTISVIGNLFAVVGNLSAGGLLIGLGETRIVMIQGIVTLVSGIPLGILLIPMFDILGLIVAGTVAGLPSMFWGIYWIWKHYKAKPDFQSSAKILAASTIASFAAYLPTYFLNTTNWIKLIIGLIVMFSVYLLGAPLIGAVSSTDIKNLKTMFSGLGAISKIINLPLNIAEEVAQARITNKKGEDS